MITIQGAVTLRSPLHTSAGYQGLRLSADGKVSSNNQDGLAVVSTLTSPLTVSGRYYGHVPIFPSSGVIGALRRFAAARMRAALLTDGKKIPLTAYYALSHGQPASAQLGSTATLEQYNASRLHPFFGLFGGASMRNAAQFMLGDLMPIICETLEGSIVPQKFADLAPVASYNLEPHHLLQYRVTRKIDDLRRGRDPLGAEDVPLEEIDADTKTEAAAAYQVMPPGTSLFFRCQLQDSTTPEQRGLFLLALQDWVIQAQMGARAHLGWGQFTAHRFRYIDGKQRLDLFDQTEDEDGMIDLQLTSDFHELTNPATLLLERYQLSPAEARTGLMALLQGQG